MTRDELITKHLPLVDKIAGRIVKRLPRFVERDELRSDGLVGLVKAADSYRPERGASFETHASIRIAGAIVDGLRSRNWVKRLDHKATEDTKRKAKARQRSINASAAMEAKALGFEAKDPPVGFDAEQADTIRALMRGVGRTERMVVLSSVVWDMSLREAGQWIGVSESRCSQIRSEALVRLRAIHTNPRSAMLSPTS